MFNQKSVTTFLTASCFAIGTTAHAATWTATAAMATPRGYHTATLLANGKVLVTGGVTTGNAIVNSAELFDVTTKAVCSKKCTTYSTA